MTGRTSPGTFGALILLVLRGIQGACVFPAVWRSHDWFKNYDTNNLADHWQVHYQGSDYTWTSVNGFLDFTVEFSCTDRTGNDSVTYYILEQTSFNSVFCSLSHTGVNSLAHKVIPHDSTNDRPVTECPDAVKGLEVDVYPTYPFSFTTKNCPFDATTYQLQYITATSGGVMCEGDASSFAMVTQDGVIRLNSCFQGQSSYEQPLSDVELRCIDTYSEELMDGDGGGDLLILADTTNDLFYCARYSTTYGRVYLSLHVQSSSAIVCYPFVTSKTATGGYVALTLTLDVPTTTSSSGDGATDDGGTRLNLAEHVVIHFTDVYEQFIMDDQDSDSAVDAIKSVISTLTGESPSRFINLEITRGEDVSSIPLVLHIEPDMGGTFVEFDIMPDFYGLSVQAIVEILDEAVKGGQFQLDREEATLTASTDFFYHYYVPQGGPCVAYGCENGGHCISLTMSKAVCDCPAEFTGFTCETDVTSGDDGTYNKILISVLTLAGVIFIVTVLSVIACLYYRDRRAPSLTPLDEDVSVSDVDFGMPKIWNAGYNQYTNATYHEPYVY